LMVWGYALTIGSIIAAFIFTGWQGGLTILFLAFVFSFTAAQSIYLHKTKERNLKFLGMVKPLAQSQLSAFLTGSGSNKPYRELVQYHIKRQSTKQLQLAVLGETSLLPEVYQPTIMSYIDATNNQLGASGNFWMQTTCRQAFEQIMNIAIEVLPLDGVITSVEDA